MATVYFGIDVRSFEVSSSAIPEYAKIIGTNAPVWGYAFDGTTREDIYTSFPLLLYGSGNITVAGSVYSRSGATSGTFVMGARIACITPGDATSMEAKAWATAQQSSSTTINSTAKGNTSFSITVSNLDSATALDEVWLNLYRLPADAGDTITSDIILTGRVYISYSDT